MIEKYNGKAGLILGITCSNLLSVSLILLIIEDSMYYLISGLMSTIMMFLRFWMYCNSEQITEVISNESNAKR